MPSGTTCPSPSPRRGRSDQQCPAHCVGRATSSRWATPTLSSTSPPRGVPCGFVVRASSTGARKRTFFQTEGTVTRSAARARVGSPNMDRVAILRRLRKSAGITLPEMAALLRVPVRSLTRGDAAALDRAAQEAARAAPGSEPGASGAQRPGASVTPTGSDRASRARTPRRPSSVERLRPRSNRQGQARRETVAVVKNLAAVLSSHPPPRPHGALSATGARVEEA
jgi:hypothetical protein